MNSRLFDLVVNYPDSMRHPIIADCHDWQRIPPALIEWASLAEKGLIVHDALRLLCEVIYVMGYQRGKTERAMPTFLIDDAAIGGKSEHERSL